MLPAASVDFLFLINYFEEHLHTAAPKMTLRRDCVGLFYGESLSKSSLVILQTRAFKPELQSQFGAYALCKLNP